MSTTNEGCGMHGASSAKGVRTCGSNTPILVEAVDALHEPRYVGAKPAASKFVGVTLRMRSETAVSKADLENLVACMLSSSDQSAKTDLVRNTSLRTEVHGSFYRVDVLAPSSEEANAVYDRVKEFVARP